MSGSRNISNDLQTSIATRSPSLCKLLKIVPTLPIYETLAMTSLDMDFVYNDGDGSLTYGSLMGVTPSAMQATSSMSVGNATSKALAPVNTPTVDLEAIRAGAYDNAEYTIYVVDWEHPEYGHWIPPNGHGIVGQQTIDEKGLSVTFELTDLTKLLKESIVENWSRDCRAIYGSQPIGTGGGVIEQKFPCGKDVSAEWSGTKTVTEVGLEDKRTFRAAALGVANGFYMPGMLTWLTGDNAGRTEMVEQQDGTGVIQVKFPMYYPIKVGDTFKIRVDCTHRPDGPNGCKAHFASVSPVEWKVRYRGEWQTPVADGDSLSTPGVDI